MAEDTKDAERSKNIGPPENQDESQSASVEGITSGDAIGVVTAVDNLVVAANENGTRFLVAGDPIYANDIIKTTAYSKVSVDLQGRQFSLDQNEELNVAAHYDHDLNLETSTPFSGDVAALVDDPDQIEMIEPEKLKEAFKQQSESDTGLPAMPSNAADIAKTMEAAETSKGEETYVYIGSLDEDNDLIGSHDVIAEFVSGDKVDLTALLDALGKTDEDVDIATNADGNAVIQIVSSPGEYYTGFSVTLAGVSGEDVSISDGIVQ